MKYLCKDVWYVILKINWFIIRRLVRLENRIRVIFIEVINDVLGLEELLSIKREKGLRKFGFIFKDLVKN